MDIHCSLHPNLILFPILNFISVACSTLTLYIRRRHTSRNWSRCGNTHTSSKPYTASAWRRITPLLDHREFVLFLKKKQRRIHLSRSQLMHHKEAAMDCCEYMHTVLFPIFLTCKGQAVESITLPDRFQEDILLNGCLPSLPTWLVYEYRPENNWTNYSQARVITPITTSEQSCVRAA